MLPAPYAQLGEFDQVIALLEICLQRMGSDMKLWFKSGLKLQGAHVVLRGASY
jgi:hypothetical protein